MNQTELKYLNAIVVVNDPGGLQFKKYHNIKHADPALARFEKHAKTKFPAAKYVNYYSKDSTFAFRRYLS